MDKLRNKVEKKRYYNIDLVRFILVVMIVFYHFIKIKTLQDYNIDIYAYMLKHSASIGIIANSILFIISGFFLYPSFLKSTETFLSFAYKKLIRFWPVLCFAVICLAVLSLFHLVKFDIGGNLLNLCMITKNGSGLATTLTNLNATWFVCWLFWISLFYYALYKVINNEFKFNFIVSILVYCCLVLYVNNKGRDFLLIFSVFPRGGILGLSTVGIGILLHSFIKSSKISMPCWFATLAEVGLLSYFVYCLCFGPLKENFIFAIVATCLLLYLFITKQGLISKYLDKPIMSKIGKYAFSIYIMQEIVFVFFKHCLWKQVYLVQHYPICIICFSLLCAVIVGIIVYHLIEQPATRILTKLYEAAKTRSALERVLPLSDV